MNAALPTYLYAIGRPEGPVKIGISNGPNGRLIALQTGCPFSLQIIHTVPIGTFDQARKHERAIHDIYAGDRLAGEWFNIDGEQAIEAIETELELDAHFKWRALNE